MAAHVPSADPSYVLDDGSLLLPMLRDKIMRWPTGRRALKSSDERMTISNSVDRGISVEGWAPTRAISIPVAHRRHTWM